MLNSAVRSLARILLVLALALPAMSACSKSEPKTAEPVVEPSQGTIPVATVKPAEPPPVYHMPTDDEIPAGEAGDAVRRGRELVTHTYESLPDNVGNGLHCSSCHLDGGTKANAAPWLGIPAVFPQFRKRSGKMASIEDRINDCFERSMNGEALPDDSADLAAIVAYMRFVSRDIPAGETPGRGFVFSKEPKTPDRAHGAELYMQRCATCHGADGAGQAPNGVYAFPALGGPRSFNIAAGMARLNTAAAFIRANMPLGQGGSLTEQEAYDIADYFIHLDRPDFPGKENDWPKGDKPADARY